MEYALGAVADFKLFGFATGTYSCKCNCGVEFIGDKRSSTCLKCAIEKAESLSEQPPTIHNSDYTKSENCHTCTNIVCNGKLGSYADQLVNKCSDFA